MSTGNKIITMTFSKIDDEKINVSTEFHSNVPVGQMFALCGQAIQGLILTARKIGNAKGMSDEQVEEAIFGAQEAKAA